MSATDFRYKPGYKKKYRSTGHDAMQDGIYAHLLTIMEDLTLPHVYDGFDQSTSGTDFIVADGVAFDGNGKLYETGKTIAFAGKAANTYKVAIIAATEEITETTGALQAEDVYLYDVVWSGSAFGTITDKRPRAKFDLSNEDSPFALDDLTDVIAPSPSPNDTIQWNGSAWVNAVPSSAGPTIQENGSDLPLRTKLDFQTGLLAQDDAGNGKTKVNIVDDSSIQKIEVKENSGASVVGTRKQLNFIAGAGIEVDVVDDAANNRVNVTIRRVSAPPGPEDVGEIQFKSSSSSSGAIDEYSPTTYITVPVPSGLANGDFLVCAISNNSSLFFTPESAWSLVRDRIITNSMRATVWAAFYEDLTAVSGNYRFIVPAPPPTCNYYISIVAYSGVDKDAPWDNEDDESYLSAVLHPLPDLKTSVDDSRLTAAIMVNDTDLGDDILPPSGWFERLDTVSHERSDVTQTTAGQTGTNNVPESSLAADSVVDLMCLRPANAFRAAATTSIAFKNSTVATSGESEVSSLNIDMPSGISDGDRMLLAVIKNKQERDFDTPSGWTLVKTQAFDAGDHSGRLSVFTKVVATPEATPLTITWGAAHTCLATATILVYDSSSVADSTSEMFYSTARYHAARRLTAPGNGCRLVVFWGSGRNGFYQLPETMTRRSRSHAGEVNTTICFVSADEGVDSGDVGVRIARAGEWKNSYGVSVAVVLQ